MRCLMKVRPTQFIWLPAKLKIMTRTAPESSFSRLFLYSHLPAECLCVRVCVFVCSCRCVCLRYHRCVCVTVYTFAHHAFVHASSCIMSRLCVCVHEDSAKQSSPHSPCRLTHYISSVVNKDQGTPIIRLPALRPARSMLVINMLQLLG